MNKDKYKENLQEKWTNPQPIKNCNIPLLEYAEVKEKKQVKINKLWKS